MTPRAILIFGAGLGTRMAPLTNDRPKPLVEVAGRALIDHALGIARAAGTGRIVVNTHYRADQMRAHLAARGVQISHEPKLLETGGGLKRALPLLGTGPCFTLNSDAVWTGPNPLDTLAAAWDPDRMDALLLCLPANRATGHRGQGDFSMDADGRLHRGGPLIYTGAQIIKPDLAAREDDGAFSLNRVWDRIAAEGRLFGAIHDGGWCDVGRPESIPLAEGLLRGNDV